MIKKYLIGGTALLPMQALISKKPKPRKTVYRSLTGKVFGTMQEAAIDNRDASMKLGIYADKDLTYTVKSGDSLWKIAKENNTDLDTLKRLNPSINPNVIKVGDIIKIGKKESPNLYNVKSEWKREADLNSNNVKAIQGVKHEGNYIIIDKANNTLSVFNNKNKLLYKTTDISTGKSGNDYNTITYVDERGHIIPGKGNESTPAGITKITGVSTYHGFPSFTRGRGIGDNVEDIASSLHFGSTDNKRASNGCVRIGGKTLNALSTFIGKGTDVYTLPEKEGSKFIVKDGKLNFIAENPYGTTEGSKKYWDDYNVHIDKSYSPLTIISKDKSKNLLYNLNKRLYIDSISKNKQTILKAFNLDSDTYNRLALIAVGIAELESKYGTAISYETKSGMRSLLGDTIIDNYINPIGRAVRQLKQGQMPHNLHLQSSRGLTQIKLKGDNAELLKIYKSFGITEDNIDNPGKSALATMLRLSHMYNTEVRGRQFSGKDSVKVNPYDALVYKWMGRNSELLNETATPKLNNYINNLKKYQKDYNLYSTRKAKQGGKMTTLEFLKNGSGIHIKKKNRGKFTDYCGGKVTNECIRRAKASGNPTLVKRATFADNARKWKHKEGGLIQRLQLGNYFMKPIKWLAHLINDYGNMPYDGMGLTAVPLVKATKQLSKKEKVSWPTNSLVAAAASLLSPFVGPLAAAPDVVFDVAASIDEPSVSNTLHTAADFPETVAKITPTKVDDYIARGVLMIGNVDDALSAGGKNLFEIFNGNHGRINNIVDKTSVRESTRTNSPKRTKYIKIKKSGGKVTDSCIRKTKANHTLVKRANVRKLKH